MSFEAENFANRNTGFLLESAYNIVPNTRFRVGSHNMKPQIFGIY